MYGFSAYPHIPTQSTPKRKNRAKILLFYELCKKKAQKMHKKPRFCAFFLHFVAFRTKKDTFSEIPVGGGNGILPIRNEQNILEILEALEVLETLEDLEDLVDLGRLVGL